MRPGGFATVLLKADHRPDNWLHSYGHYYSSALDQQVCQGIIILTSSRLHDLYAVYQRATFDHVREERSWQTSFEQLLLLPGHAPDQRKLDL